jgi:lipoprotein-anchoring transpeptidase ErfK/SrfK
MDGVPVYTKLQLVRSRKKSGNKVLWFALTLIALAVLSGLWWLSRLRTSGPESPTSMATNRTTTDPSSPATSVSRQPATTGGVGRTSTLPVIVARTSTPALAVPRAQTSGNKLSVPAPMTYPRTVSDTLEAQIALARLGISSGPIDGLFGSQTRAALRAFQRREQLPVTGTLDEPTRLRLMLTESPERIYTVTSDDLVRLKPLGATWLAKSHQERLEYETLLEMLAERHMAHPNLIRAMNPGVNWSQVPVGTAIRVPFAEPPPVRVKAAFVRIQLAARTLQAFDAATNLLAHFPCSIARKVDKRPIGQLFVENIAIDPNYTFNPEMYPESPEARELGRILVLPPGPNNPVGTAWIGLNRPGYGIHGTPKPEEVGRTESHGCFRLANWNAEFLSRLMAIGTPVWVEP